ncbi:MAG: tRNA (adenosine(37)-N6)-threonylcarbamoyltransferase complex ATPase subunit type 1 TsaE [Patescibacteria group bacterium]|nr:tRNA (adenosine(37)-N6)-threonylcarbamoyltransferase complex ATPase subunit type 1 TsaE [Patescibacteria group bacterium]
MQVLLENLPAFSREVLGNIEQRKNRAFVLFLQGELGAGKTTFMQALAREIGIKGTVQSPTFVLMRAYPISYKGFTKLVHIDAYRFEKPDEFRALRPNDFLKDPHTLVCIEWPERIEGMLQNPDLTIQFLHRDAMDSREINLQ